MDLSKQMAPIHIRAFAELAGEVFRVPDPLSLVSRMSCANFIMRQWTSCIFHEDPLSIDGSSDELHGTFWIKEGNTSKSTTLNIVYDLTSHWNKEIWTELKNKGIDWNSDTWNIFKNRGLTYPFHQNEFIQSEDMITFDAIAVITSAFQKRGMHQFQEQNGKTLLPQHQANSVEELNIIVENYETKWSSYTPKARARQLEKVFTLTITAITEFNPSGRGRPLLTSSNAKVISTGGTKRNTQIFSEKTDWANDYSDLLTLPLKEVFQKLESGGDNDDVKAFKLLSDLSRHVMVQNSHAIIGEEASAEGNHDDEEEIVSFNNDDDSDHHSQGEVDLTVDENFEMSAEDVDWMIQDVADANVDGDILI